jgi:hypothetical protein
MAAHKNTGMVDHSVESNWGLSNLDNTMATCGTRTYPPFSADGCLTHEILANQFRAIYAWMSRSAVFGPSHACN